MERAYGTSVLDVVVGAARDLLIVVGVTLVAGVIACVGIAVANGLAPVEFTLGAAQAIFVR